MSKVCSRCREQKQLDAFHKHSGSIDGRQCYCKECNAEFMRNYWHTDRGREINAKRQEKDRRRFRQAVRKKVYLAIKAGKLPHATACTCKDCGRQAEIYHHPDYGKPLQVVPLCQKCDRARHRQFKAREAGVGEEG